MGAGSIHARLAVDAESHRHAVVSNNATVPAARFAGLVGAVGGDSNGIEEAWSELESSEVTRHDHALVVQVSRPARAGLEACTTMAGSQPSIWVRTSSCSDDDLVGRRHHSIYLGR